MRVRREIRHIIVSLCIIVHSATQISTRINMFIPVLMMHFAKLGLHLSAFLSLSLLPAAASLLLSLICFLTHIKSVKQLYRLLLVGTSPVPPILGLNCVLYVYVCEYDSDKLKSEHVQKIKRGRKTCKVSMWVCLPVWVGVPVKLQNYFNWERNAGMLSSDSDRSQISLSDTVSPQQASLQFHSDWRRSKKREGGNTEKHEK